LKKLNWRFWGLNKREWRMVGGVLGGLTGGHEWTRLRRASAVVPPVAGLWRDKTAAYDAI